jgi:hypothetical protein
MPGLNGLLSALAFGTYVLIDFTNPRRIPMPHIKMGSLHRPVQHISPLTAKGSRPDRLLPRCVQMLFGQWLEELCYLIRFAENCGCATHHGECARNIPQCHIFRIPVGVDRVGGDGDDRCIREKQNAECRQNQSGLQQVDDQERGTRDQHAKQCEHAERL